MKKLRLALVGLGSVMQRDHLQPAESSNSFELIAVCDVDESRLTAFPVGSRVHRFKNLDEMLDRERPDAAIVAVPHDAYAPVLRVLSRRGVHTLKEKPFATNLSDASALQAMYRGHKTVLQIVQQRRYNPLYTSFFQLQRHIGHLVHVDVQYTFSIANIGDGWRAQRAKSGGGCLIDMGYHMVDLLVWYLGLPATIWANMGRAARPEQEYDVEDTCNAFLEFPAVDDAPPFAGRLLVSRVFPEKQERIFFLGTSGSLELNRNRIRRLDRSGQTIEELSRSGDWPSAYLDQLSAFATSIRRVNSEGTVEDGAHPHFAHVAIIEAAYRSCTTGERVKPADLLAQHRISL